ncbi:MAG: dTDP-4-dehydrorhamnose reductase [Acidithiobacillus sp.]
MDADKQRTSKRVLITGAGGQVGRALAQSVPAGVQAIFVDRQQLDISDAAAVTACVCAHQPQIIINAAAYTAVDRAESEPDRAQAINAVGPGHLARAASTLGAELLHISTDFVFSGSQGEPYRPRDAVAPVNVYGASKAAGEQAIRETLGEDALILRTSWVYAPWGQNFLQTMLRLMETRPRLRVVCDQVGSPTSALSLADALWRATAQRDFRGTQHWTDAGVASWYDFAVAIQEEALALGLLSRSIPIEAIPASAYPTPARRPANSQLDKTEAYAALGAAPHWRVALRRVLSAQATSSTA